MRGWQLNRSCPTGFVLFVVVLAGLAFALPAEDVRETPYDESESLPYEASAVFSISVPKTVADGSAAPLCVSPFRFSFLRGLGSQRPGQGTGSAYSVCDSLIILNRSLRC